MTGATAGLGLAVAESLAGAGANIVLHDLVEPKETGDRLRSRSGVDVVSVAADLSLRPAIETMMADLLGRIGAIDILVNNAVVRQMLAITNAKYGAASDFTSIAKVLEEWAGVEMRG